MHPLEVRLLEAANEPPHYWAPLLREAADELAKWKAYALGDQEKDWGGTGYRDALNGNAPWIPHKANANVRAAYIDGYERGVMARPKSSTAATL